MIDALFPTLPLASQALGPAALFLIALILCLLAGIFLWSQAAIHSRRLQTLPIRIHVAGTRGKSATVRLIAAGLRAGGYRVVAKMTGAQPQIIVPDGSEQTLQRWGAATIREQRGFIAAAHRLGANAVVVEAMGIEPEYLAALEQFYIRATDLVITNVRPDHQEQLGEAPDAMADAVSEAVPTGGRLFLTFEAGAAVILARAALQNCAVSMARSDPAADPEDANRQLALAVCRRHGVASAEAGNAMQVVAKDVGAFTLTAVHIDGRIISFANGFSCNDVQSFERLWRRHQEPGRPAAFVLNARGDRPLRTRAFLSLLVRLAPDAPLFIIGEGLGVRRQALAAGFTPERVRRLRRPIGEHTWRAVSASIDENAVVWGVGNFRGAGARLSAIAEAARAPC